MTPPTRRDVQSLFAPSIPTLALASALVLATLAVVGTGCGQEGKTIETTLPVQALAYDAPQALVTSNTLGDTISVLVNVRFKIQTTYANGCEARGGLELRLEGPTSEPLFVISPVARYTADEECNIGIAGDTLQILNVTGIRMNLPRTAATDSITRFEVRGLGMPPIRFNVNTNVASRGDTATGFFVLVEDKDSGTPVDGAIVRVERYGTPDVLGEGTTSGGGRFAFNVACADTAGDVADPYVVKVSYLSRITILTVLESPSLCKRREQIIVRV